jgi:hypothetical protein
VLVAAWWYLGSSFVDLPVETAEAEVGAATRVAAAAAAKYVAARDAAGVTDAIFGRIVEVAGDAHSFSWAMEIQTYETVMSFRRDVASPLAIAADDVAFYNHPQGTAVFILRSPEGQKILALYLERARSARVATMMEARASSVRALARVRADGATRAEVRTALGDISNARAETQNGLVGVAGVKKWRRTLSEAGTEVGTEMLAAASQEDAEKAMRRKIIDRMSKRYEIVRNSQ